MEVWEETRISKEEKGFGRGLSDTNIIGWVTTDYCYESIYDIWFQKTNSFQKRAVEEVLSDLVINPFDSNTIERLTSYRKDWWIDIHDRIINPN